MAPIYVISCSNEDNHETENKSISLKNNENEDEHLKGNTEEQSFSIYELLSNEYEQENPAHLQSSSTLRNVRTTNGICEANSKTINNRFDMPAPSAIAVPQSQRSSTKPDQNIPEISLNSERLRHEGQFRRRREVFQSIIFNRPLKTTWIKGLLNTPIIIIFGFLTTVPLSLIPAHDLIKFPNHWYEHIFHAIFSTTFGWILQCFRASYFLNVKKIRKWRNITFLCLIGDVAMILFIVIVHRVWTSVYGHTYPVPFLGIVATYLFRVLYTIAQWVSLPNSWRHDKKFRQQMKFFMAYIICTILIDVFYNIAVAIVRNSSDQNQPYVSLLLPLARELCLWLSAKLLKNCCNGDVGAPRVILNTIVVDSK